MAAAGNRGMLLYKFYRALSYCLTPLVHLHLRWRRRRGLEHPTRWPERLGRPSLHRPSGPLLWFHAVSLGEGMAAVPVIKRCVQCRPDLSILMTTTTLSAFEVIKNQLPIGVLYQFSPLDIPGAMDAFLDYWKPSAIMIMESELWPNLIMGSSRKGISLALLNARVSMKSFRLWSQPALLPLISLMLSKFSLIIPLSTMQAIYFQILQAPPVIINFSGDLKFAVEYDASNDDTVNMEDLKGQLAHRHIWMASSIHRGEEKGVIINDCKVLLQELSNVNLNFVRRSANLVARNVARMASSVTDVRVWEHVPPSCIIDALSFDSVMLGVHKALIKAYPDLVTIIVPRYPQHGQEIAQEFRKEGQNVALRSQHQRIMPGTKIYVVDTLGELIQLYRLSPVAVIGGSFFPGLAGHNISEAAAAGCAVLTGHHVGHFSHMVNKMQRLNPLSVIQVSSTLELEETIMQLFSDAKVLEARRMAAKQAFQALSSGIIANIWSLLNFHVIRKSL